MRSLFFVVCTMVFSIIALRASCPPGYSPFQVTFIDNGCEIKIDLCAINDPITHSINIVMGDVEMNGTCGCKTRQSIINDYNTFIIDGVLPVILPTIPPCPSTELLVKISPSACATDCINTGCYKTWSDGTYGPIYKSWSCTSDLGCRSVYSICCDTQFGNCPPRRPSITLIGTEIVPGTTTCGTKEVPVCGGLLDTIILECKAQCTE